MIRLDTFVKKKNPYILKNTKLSFTKGRILLLAIFLAFVQIVNAQLLQWNTFGNTGTETTEPSVYNDVNISAANLIQGTITPVKIGDRFGGSNWFDTGDTNPTTLTESITGNDYIQFIVTPNAGYSFTPTSFVFTWDRSATGPSSVTLRSSVDGFTSDLGTVSGLGAAISTGNTITISGLTNITTATTFRLYGFGATGTAGTGGFDVASDVVNVQLNGTTSSLATIGWCNLQWPTTNTINEGEVFDVYARVYANGITNSVGQGTTLSAWIGYSTSNDINTGTWTWIPAIYNADDGTNNDEYKASIGAGITLGIYYYVSRFQIGSGSYSYGGINNNFWVNTSNSASLTVNSNKVDWCNLQSPPSGSIQEGGTFNVYARVNEPGVTNAAGQGAGITAWIGVSPIGSNTNPNTWTTWIPAIFNVDAGNDDEYMVNIATGLVPGTYFYASRFQKTGSNEYSYGGTGGFWNNDSGVLTVTSNKVEWCNLQYPDWGSIEQGGDYGVYAQVHEPGVTDAAGQGSGISAWIGYSTTDTDPSTWTNWIPATYNSSCLICNNGQNDEYFANIGPGLSPGTYYYASRFQKISSSEFTFGGYNTSGEGFWNNTYSSGTGNRSGQLIVLGACLKFDFEDATKTSYAEDEIVINGKNWLLSQALIGTETNDFKVDSKSIRMRAFVNAKVELLEDQFFGVDRVKFKYRSYGTDDIKASFLVEYSKDSGNSWFQLGSSITPTSTVQTFDELLNQSGPVRIRIKYNSGDTSDTNRINIDDIELCHYSNDREIEVFGNATTIQNGSTTTKISNATNFSSSYFINSGALTNIYTIANTGTGILTLQNPTLSGSGDFTISSPLSSTSLVAGASATFAISFSSSSAGIKTATVFIINGDTDENPFTFDVSATVENYIGCTLSAKGIIAQQDFETVPAIPILNYTETGGTVTGGSAYGSSRTSVSNKFIGNQSYQVNNNSSTLTTESIDVSDYKNIVLSFSLGGYSISTNQGLDSPDQVHVLISTDDGTTWVEQLIIQGNNNSIFDINTATGNIVSIVFDPNMLSGLNFGAKSNSTNTFSKNFKIIGLPNSTQLKIKFEIKNDNANEIWVLDSIKLEGQLPNIKTWNAGSWTPAGTPTNKDKIIFIDDYSTSASGDVSGCECEISLGKTITISADNNVSIESNIENNGVIKIENKGSLVQRNDNANNTGTGNYQVEKTTGSYYNYDYIFWSSPLVNTTIGTIFPLTQFPNRRFKQDASNYLDVMKGKGYPQLISGGDGYDDDGYDWVKLYDSEIMQPGVGYIVMGKGSPMPFNSSYISLPQTGYSVQFNGKVNNGIIQPEVHKDLFTGIDSYNTNINLIGNPYPSAIDIIELYKENSSVLTGVFYFWTHDRSIAAIGGPMSYDFSNTSYATGTVVGGVFTQTKNSSDKDIAFPRYIASAQSFMANVREDIPNSPTTLTFKNSMRVTTPNTSFLRQAQDITEDFSRIWLNMTNGAGVFRQLAVGFNPLLHDQFAEGEDAPLIDSANDSNFYSTIPNNNGHFAIQFLGEFEKNKIIPLGVEILKADTYTISIDKAEGIFKNNQAIYLEDKYLNILHNFESGVYSFYSPVGVNINDRFVLRFTDTALGIDENTLENVVIYPNPSKGIFNLSYQGTELLQIEVYDLLGKKLMSQKPTQKEANTYVIDLSGYTTGIYLAKITGEGKQITRKLVVE